MIYFIRNGTAVKIGFTENKISLDARLKAIQSCNPYTITLEATMRGSKLKERCMHGFCLKKHLHGEWFIMTKGEVMQLIKEYENWNPTENNVSKHTTIYDLTRKNKNR